ncbi:hypothetical protein BJ508DRAFT_313490 [Ascobolus immersus RN42]|uniref:Uncharacterized protein n=1 Tax=Ascobolus immersus RN42 TaxID=1160509 RepID=A0A3N4HIN1_ASCIM|nr:hypothetical protein BJ508DRAFT_313490 [Ascobolus immersus RN42]
MAIRKLWLLPVIYNNGTLAIGHASKQCYHLSSAPLSLTPFQILTKDILGAEPHYEPSTLRNLIEEGKTFTPLEIEALIFPSEFSTARVQNEIPSEFIDYYTWLRDERCYPLGKSLRYVLWKPDSAYWAKTKDPECYSFAMFLHSKGKKAILFDEFLAYNCTFENPRRWDAMPQEYREWRRPRFGEGVRECLLPRAFENATESELFKAFGYLQTTITSELVDGGNDIVPLARIGERPKCERLVWDDADTTSGTKKEQFNFWDTGPDILYWFPYETGRY